jgi:prevent-host-death family protein
MVWQVQDAKARFSEFLDASLRCGPQVVTRRGVETAVLVAITEWRRLTHAARPTLKQLLLAPEAQFDILAPARGERRRRQPRGSA